MPEASANPVKPSGREEWRPVVGYEAYYEVSTWGNIRRTYFRDTRRRGTAPRPLRPSTHRKTGYLKVTLCGHGKRVDHLLHRVVARTFLGEPLPNQEVAHLDGNRANCCLANLDYTTRRENLTHQKVHGTAGLSGRAKCGSRMPTGRGSFKLSVEQIAEVRRAPGTQREIAEQYGVTPSAISKIKSGRTARWLA